MRRYINLFILLAVLTFFTGYARAEGLEWNADDKMQWDALTEKNIHLFENRDFKSCIENELKALALAEKNVGPDHHDTAENYNALGLFYSEIKDDEKAEQYFDRALAIFEKTPDLKDDRQVFENRCELQVEHQFFDKAEASCGRYLEIAEKIFGPEDQVTYHAIKYLGTVYIAQKQYDKAEPLFKRALPITKKVNGFNSKETSFVLGMLGAAYQGQKDFENAEKSLSQALEIAQSQFDSKDPILAKILNNLAAAYAEQGKYDEALPLIERAVAIYEKSLFPDREMYALSVYNIGTFYLMKRQYEKAIPQLERALILHQKIDPNHRGAIQDLIKLYIAYGEVGEFEKSEDRAEQAIDLIKKTYGPKHPMISGIQGDLKLIRKAIRTRDSNAAAEE